MLHVSVPNTCRFLLDTFGRERLASGSGVLDVAGGKGHIAFELVNLNGIPATVVEPRPISLAKCAVQLQVWGGLCLCLYTYMGGNMTFGATYSSGAMLWSQQEDSACCWSW